MAEQAAGAPSSRSRGGISAALLRNVKLRSSKSSLDKKLAVTSALRLESALNSKRNNERLRAVDIEAWYDDIKEHTFKTVFVPIAPRDAKAIVAAYQSKKASNMDAKTQGSEDDATLTTEQKACLVALKTKIDQAMLTMQSAKTNGVFAKLSSRSPKDSWMCRRRALSLVKEKLAKLRDDKCAVDGNSVTSAIMASTIESLKLSSAAEVIESFATSDRVCEDDIPLALNYPKIWNQHIVLREWVSIPTYCELRAFVMDRKITGLCQYYTSVYFPELVAEKEKMLRIAMACFQDIKDKLKIDPPEYSIDFAIDLKNNRAYVIELNPFGKPDGLGTGTALFSNKSPADLAILFGDKPFEFRIETKVPQTDARQSVKGPLRDWLEKQGMMK